MAGSRQDVRRRETGDLPIDVCVDSARWRLLRILQLHPGWITEGRLAAKLEAARPDGAGANRRSRIQLRHSHLPELAGHDLLVWKEREGMVRGTELTSTVVDELAELIAVVADADGPPAAAVANERRRRTLAILDAEPGPVSREQLARDLLGRDGDGRPPQASVRDVEIDLHHHHLPKLEDAELVDYDSDEGTVTYCGPPALPTALPER